MKMGMVAAAAALVAASIGAAGAGAMKPPVSPGETPPAPMLPPGVGAPPPGAPAFPGAPEFPTPPSLPNLPSLPEPALTVPHTIGELAFLEGRWLGKVGDNEVEEQWSGARGSSMMGMFRWMMADGSPYMFQLMTLTQEAGGAVVMRLRDFGPAMEQPQGEGKDKAMVLRLAEIERNNQGDRAVFRGEGDAAAQADRVVYERRSPGSLRFTVHFVESAGREPFVVEFTRDGEGADPAAAPPR